jgi:hypothetical protein
LKVVLYGSTGKAGSVILKELVDRGHVASDFNVTDFMVFDELACVPMAAITRLAAMRLGGAFDGDFN